MTDRALLSAIRAAFPDLTGTPVVLGRGTDATALLFGDQVVRSAVGAAAQRLQREAQVLAVAAPRVTLPVPRPQFHAGPPAMVRHRLLAGQALETADYGRLPFVARDRLAADLALFHAECHRMDAMILRAAGAGEVHAWPVPGPQMLAHVPAHLQAAAQEVLAGWQALPPDPLGQVWGHFDAHGWNMAFDAASQRLAGIFDFGDSGFGDLHRDLVYSALVSPDLMRRLGRAYAALTGRAIDLERLRILSGAHRLWELAGADAAGRAGQVAALQRWAEAA